LLVYVLAAPDTQGESIGRAALKERAQAAETVAGIWGLADWSHLAPIGISEGNQAARICSNLLMKNGFMNLDGTASEVRP
jgi:hypothetical protein